MVADIDASDKDAYQSDDMTLRFNGLDIVAAEDEDLDIAVTFQDGIDSGDRIPHVTGLRYFDADGVAETLTNSDIDVDPVSFTLSKLLVLTMKSSLRLQLTIQMQQPSRLTMTLSQIGTKCSSLILTLRTQSTTFSLLQFL